MSANRRDRVPVHFVIRHVQEWAERSNDGQPPAFILAMRTGMDVSLFERLIKGSYTSKHMAFDCADRIFCALGDPVNIWRSDEEIRRHYEKGSQGADALDAVRGLDEYAKYRERRLWKAREAA